jgi:hypothetical protein
MRCGKCRTEARWVVNGISANLQYWYCDTCKDVASDDWKEYQPAFYAPGPSVWVSSPSWSTTLHKLEEKEYD